MSASSSSITTKESQIQTLTLIPGLPNDLAGFILTFVPYSHHARLKLTSKSWKIFFSSKALISLRKKSKFSHLLCVFPQDPSVSSPYLFDPQNLAWCPLPPMPCNPHVYGLCNFTSISVASHLYVLGGSLFDTRSFPMDRPTPSSSSWRYDFLTHQWESLSPMLSPRGSFACVAVPNSDKILVAGGGSRHTLFGAAGNRMSSVEMYDIRKDEWVALNRLPRFRAGCVGFLVGNGDENEFWVMGGYGESRTVLGLFPVDEHYRDAVVINMKNGGGTWRELGDMWQEGERRRLGRIAVLDGQGWDTPGIFMLDGNEIFRYEMSSNHWWKQTNVPKKFSDESSVGFVSLDGELHILGLQSEVDMTESRRPRQNKRSSTLLVQIFNPEKNTWRSLNTKTPFSQPLDLKTAVMCTVQL